MKTKKIVFESFGISHKISGLKIFVLLIFFGIAEPKILWSQTSETSRENLERIIERFVSELDPEKSEQQILEVVEYLEELAANPVNINRAGLDELSQIPGLNLQLAQSIIQYREGIKPFETTSELTEVDGIGAVTLDRISPFVTIGSSAEQRRDFILNRKYWTSNGRFESLASFRQVLSKREGYTRPDSLGGYSGSPVKYNQRFRYRSNHLSINLTQDKDPGEPLADPTDFDYTSWHFAVEDVGRLKNLIVGEFRVSYGQGLTLWNGSSFGKSSSVIGSAVKNDPGIRPYTSYQETNAFKGVAATYGDQLQISGFYSNRKRTASEITDQTVRFPTQTALHRTLTERERRLNLGQETFGGRIRYQFGSGILGVSGYQNRFDRAVGKGTQPYQIHQFSGKQHSVTGADYRLTFGSAMLFGEVASSSNGGIGFISGSEINLAGGSNIAIAYRNYAQNFQSLFGSGFGEQSNPQNESGFFAGLHQAFGEKLQLNAYVDHFMIPGARFRNSRPTSGYDWLTRLEFSPTSDLSLYGQFRFKKREQQMDTTDGFGRDSAFMGNEMRSNARIHLEYRALASLRLRTRFDIVRWRETKSSSSYGYLLFQDFRLTPRKNLTIDARVTLFQTEDFSSRVFQFENDLLYVMSNKMLFNQGQRTYIVVRYQPNNSFIFRLKASTTLYEDRNVIGSGLDEIKSNRRTDIGLQVQIKI